MRLATPLLKPDATLKNFFHYKSRFADIINLVCFDGQPILSRNSLSNEDTDMSTVFDFDEHPISFNAYRDTLVKVSVGGIYALIAIENQKAIDYHIPVRTFVYDASSYKKQYQDYLDEKKRNKEAKLKLIPIITVVLYYGERKWSGPRTLLDMMELPEEMKGIMNDWNTHIIDVKELDASLLTDKDNRDLIEGLQMFYKWQGDLEFFKERKMSRDTAIVLASLVDKGEELLKIVRKEEKEEIDMCESIDNFRKKAVQEGMCLTILKQLNKKVGYLSSEVVTMIENSSREQLEKLAVEIVSIKDEHDIFVLLQSY
ncbi:Rpn family recombination-promoting nuclease/putative transposase [Coprobacillus cateniformis]|jgi:hypothetical protein|nr:Rpn family recombination-promoting nuclease/putative transposase [Coprobacillus cateniformis]PWM87837.1 MAG: DUF4351 domain-containing protein [Coprobacillus sp.]